MRENSWLLLGQGIFLNIAAVFVLALTAHAQEQPVADAGSDRSVSPGTAVVLDGRGSRGDGIVFAWRQLLGPADVPLRDTAGPTLAFRIPEQPGDYVFLLAVRDSARRSATDVVTITVRLPLEHTLAARVAIGIPGVGGGGLPGRIGQYVRLFNSVLLGVSVAVVLLALFERMQRLFARLGLRWRRQVRQLRQGDGPQQALRVVDTRSGQGLGGVRLRLREMNGNRQLTARTDRHGTARLQLSPGVYLLGLEHPAYAMTPGISPELLLPGEQPYTGGYFEVKAGSHELRVAVPAQPAGDEALPLLTAWRLRGWQFIQRQGHVWAWAVLVGGALLNTALLLMLPLISLLSIEVAYIILVGIKLILETRDRPSYGIVRDGITHLPIDLAVVRLYDQQSGRLVMTRVTDGQGKFFALPPRGAYTLVVSRTGYTAYQQEGVQVHGAEDEAVHLIAELMPLVRQAAAPLAGGEAA